MSPRRLLVPAALAIALLLAGCAAPPPRSPDPGPDDVKGYDGTSWPRLSGVTLTILDHGAPWGFEEAKQRFENLTGARVLQVQADDTGAALARAIREKGAPSFDVIYGLDNVLLARAEAEGILHAYKPFLADRVDARYRFFPDSGAWPATPVDHGYIAINWDPRHPDLREAHLESLLDVRDHARLFVTQDPRTSTPGLGFLLATIATFPEGAPYDWKAYWRDLFSGGVVVTAGWTEAYEQRFSGGYGVDAGGLGDKPIVTSYSTSPAYEHFYGRPREDAASALVADNATFQQIQTMAILKGTRNLLAAKAWIEWTLTDEFQDMAAPLRAVYPAVPGVRVNGTFADLDPAPDTFVPARFEYRDLAQRLETWVRQWVDLCEAANCA
ncbi:MAG TPA: thiamine ABC transporter substrate-binding protein [Candidatus Thermoplasmatota archaeon]|nr:thiamine ABC transporter substrate-binding protein [Candidatus Thermoplasmatota archaeon]